MSDYIDRQQAIDAVGKEPYVADIDGAPTRVYRDVDVMWELYHLPSAQQWIPVEERLPEDGVYVLICDGEHFKDYDCKNGAYSQIAVGWTEHGEFRCWDDRTHMSRVIAWMPLPEPYKEGDTDDNTGSD